MMVAQQFMAQVAGLLTRSSSANSARPPLAGLTVPNRRIVAGEPIVLTWRVEARSAELLLEGLLEARRVVASHGTWTVFAPRPGAMLVTLMTHPERSDEFGPPPRVVTKHVAVDAAPIRLVLPSRKLSAAPGQQVTLVYYATGAAGVRICRSGEQLELSPRGAVSLTMGMARERINVYAFDAQAQVAAQSHVNLQPSLTAVPDLALKELDVLDEPLEEVEWLSKR